MNTLALSMLAGVAVAASTNTPVQPPGKLPPAAANRPAQAGSISIREMLVAGPPQLKLHSLIMISQGKVEEAIDESFLPGFKACAADPSAPIRSMTAQLLGQHFIEGKEAYAPEAVALLQKLAADESSDVRYSAAYYGLSRMAKKDAATVGLLLDVAAADRDQELYERLIESLKEEREPVTKLLDEKLAQDGAVGFYEIYADFTGRQPPQEERYLNLPCSRPRIFIFKAVGGDAAAARSALEAELKAIGVTAPEVYISGEGESAVLLLKIYLTKDRLAVEQAFAAHEAFHITQDLWLTPPLQIRINALRQRSADR